MKELTCIVCPNSCSLKIEKVNDAWVVTGNKCKRGENFAINEMTRPMRTISSTVRTTFKDAPVVPVRVSGEIPKDKIFDVMNEINKVLLNKRVKRGYPVIKNCLDLKIDIIVTSNVLVEKGESHG
jgi:CxxC motif-containing protein